MKLLQGGPRDQGGRCALFVRLMGRFLSQLVGCQAPSPFFFITCQDKQSWQEEALQAVTRPLPRRQVQRQTC